MMLHSCRAFVALMAAGLMAVMSSIVVAGDAWLETEFRQRLDEAGIPGGALAVVRDGNVVLSVGHGVRASGRPEPVTPETVFRVASVSKTFAAQLAAMSAAEGRMGWDDDLLFYLPGFRLADPDQRLTVRHLLSHTTGIVPNAYDNLLNAGRDLEQIVPRFAELEPMCAPGSCYTYQNVLYALIGPVLEQATGQSYEDLLASRIFRPLNMATASSGLEAYLAADNRAWPHVRPGRAPVWFATEVNENYYRVSPAAGVNASAMDLAQWLIALQGRRCDVIDPATVRQLTEPRIRTARELRRRAWRDLLDDAHYGLGWRIYHIGDERLYMHNGWVRGFVAGISYSQERQVGLAVLINAESSVLNEVVTAFWQQEMARPVHRLVEHVSDTADFGPGPTVKGGD